MTRRRRDVVETDDYAAMLRRMLRAYARRVGQADDVDLAVMADLAREVDDLVAAAVAAQRAGGRSWGDVGRALGVTRQAAQQRFGSRSSASQPSAPADTDPFPGLAS